MLSSFSLYSLALALVCTSVSCNVIYFKTTDVLARKSIDKSLALWSNFSNPPHLRAWQLVRDTVGRRLRAQAPGRRRACRKVARPCNLHRDVFHGACACHFVAAARRIAVVNHAIRALHGDRARASNHIQRRQGIYQNICADMNDVCRQGLA